MIAWALGQLFESIKWAGEEGGRHGFKVTGRIAARLKLEKLRTLLGLGAKVAS